MTVEHEKSESKGAFFIEDEQGRAAEMTYSKAGDDKFIIDHTEVEERYRGKNIGLKLVEAAVQYAQTNSLKIMPLCPFAKKMFDRHPEFADVLW